jgi:ubiquinone biosynthesis protein
VGHVRSLIKDVATGVRPPRPRGAVELRKALIELGPAYVKLGQLLSTRADLVPPGYAQELAKLQTRVTPVPVSAVRATVREELGRDVDDVYVYFDDVPLAAASIGQVHAASLADGDRGPEADPFDVVVKVRRPDVAQLVEADLRLFERVAGLVAALSDRTRDRLDPRGLAEEFATTLRRECDYRVEASVAERLGGLFAATGQPVHVPRIHWSATAAGVLTMERITGLRLDDVDGLRGAGLDPSLVAERFADAFMSMVFTFGVFHADPHPGNVFVQPDGSLTLIDFGKHGELDPALRAGLARVMAGLVAGDPDELVDALEDLKVAGGDEDRDALRAELSELVGRYGSTPLGQLQLGAALGEVLTVVRRHRLRLPPDLMLLLATVMMCEGVALTLDPDFVLQPVILRWVAQGFGPGGS